MGTEIMSPEIQFAPLPAEPLQFAMTIRAEANLPLEREANARPHAAVQLIDNSGVTWIRHFCRSCRKTPLWAVLGEPTPMCRECAEHLLHSEPLGYRRFDRLPTDWVQQEFQYHGERPFAEG